MSQTSIMEVTLKLTEITRDDIPNRHNIVDMDFGEVSTDYQNIFFLFGTYKGLDDAGNEIYKDERNYKIDIQELLKSIEKQTKKN